MESFQGTFNNNGRRRGRGLSRRDKGHMGARQFFKSCVRIAHARHVNRPRAFWRHVEWQGRKLARRFPVVLPISRSVIEDDEPGGVISLVNSLGMYDFNNMTLIRELLGDGGTFLDIGANIGSYSLIISECPQVTVLSFEPNPAAFAKLCRNLEKNGRSTAHAFNFGLSNSTGMATMTNNGSSPINRVVLRSSGDTNLIDVPVRPLSDFLDNLTQPVVAKIDVEGHEPAVLEGAGNALSEIAALIIENGTRAEIVAYLHSHGFRGPFYYGAEHRRLSLLKPRWAEDEVFLGPRYESSSAASHIVEQIEN